MIGLEPFHVVVTMYLFTLLSLLRNHSGGPLRASLCFRLLIFDTK